VGSLRRWDAKEIEMSQRWALVFSSLLTVAMMAGLIAARDYLLPAKANDAANGKVAVPSDVTETAADAPQFSLDAYFGSDSWWEDALKRQADEVDRDSRSWTADDDDQRSEGTYKSDDGDDDHDDDREDEWEEHDEDD
jgi:hypothetical protein